MFCAYALVIQLEDIWETRIRFNKFYIKMKKKSSQVIATMIDFSVIKFIYVFYIVKDTEMWRIQ